MGEHPQGAGEKPLMPQRPLMRVPSCVPSCPIFPNAACVTALIDRLTHHAEIIPIVGES